MRTSKRRISGISGPERDTGPGSRIDGAGGLPRKTGVSLFIELFIGNFWDLVKLNLLLCACALPTAALFILGLLGFFTNLAYLLSLVAALPVGGAVAAHMFCITNILRDEPGYILKDFKRKYLENWKQAAPLGILCAVFIYAQVFIWGPLIFGGAGADILWLIPGAAFLLSFNMVAPYVFLQIAYIKLSTMKILKNGILISFMNAPRSFMGAVIGFIPWAAFVLFLPNSAPFTPLIPVIAFSLSWLISLMWVWPIVDKQFKISETLRGRE